MDLRVPEIQVPWTCRNSMRVFAIYHDQEARTASVFVLDWTNSPIRVPIYTSDIGNSYLRRSKYI